MTEESTGNSLPTPGGWAPGKIPPSPGATETKPKDAQPPAADCWSSAQSKSPGATDDQAKDGSISRGRSERLASFGALLSAFIASSWCWLPPLLILGGISGAGMTTFVAEWRPVFIAVTIGFLAAAFYFAYRPRPGAGNVKAAGEGAAADVAGPRSRIMTLNKIMLWGVTVIAVVFLFFPGLFASLGAADDEVTPAMEHTTVAIEGMTWHSWVPGVERALRAVPGVLAAKVDYKAKQAKIGFAKGRVLPKDAILKALKKLNYRASFIDEADDGQGPWAQTKRHGRSSCL